MGSKLSLLTLSMYMLGASALSLGSEIDPFTKRHLMPNLKNSYEILNKKMNEMIDESLNKANKIDQKKKRSCNEKILLETVNATIGGRPYGIIEKLIEKSPDIDRHTITKKESVYKDFTFFQAPVFLIAKLGSSIRVNDLYLGADKFGHFAAQGWIYFNEKYKKGKKLEGALKWGEKSESRILGQMATGIYSYGDLVANYNGLAFFERILGNKEEREPKAKAGAPYIVCQNGHWVRGANFEWSDYIDAGWDEGHNRVKFRTAKHEKKVQRSLASLNLQCPLDQDLCYKAFQNYPESVAKRIFHPLCQQPNPACQRSALASDPGIPLGENSQPQSAAAVSSNCQ